MNNDKTTTRRDEKNVCFLQMSAASGDRSHSTAIDEPSWHDGSVEMCSFIPKKSMIATEWLIKAFLDLLKLSCGEKQQEEKKKDRRHTLLLLPPLL